MIDALAKGSLEESGVGGWEVRGKGEGWQTADVNVVYVKRREPSESQLNPECKGARVASDTIVRLYAADGRRGMRPVRAKVHQTRSVLLAPAAGCWSAREPTNPLLYLHDQAEQFYTR